MVADRFGRVFRLNCTYTGLDRYYIDTSMTARCSRTYKRLRDAALSGFADNVSANLLVSEFFKTPPVTPADLTALKDTFDELMVEAYKGSKASTAAKNAGRDLLIEALDKDASYVDINCK